MNVDSAIKFAQHFGVTIPEEILRPCFTLLFDLGTKMREDKEENKAVKQEILKALQDHNKKLDILIELMARPDNIGARHSINRIRGRTL